MSLCELVRLSILSTVSSTKLRGVAMLGSHAWEAHRCAWVAVRAFLLCA